MVPLHRQLDTQQYKPALALIETLLTELKRLDDKLVLTEVHLLESRVYRGIGNLAKAKVRNNQLPPCVKFSFARDPDPRLPFLKAALTSSRTAANSIYCPPQLQARLDLQSGILHAEDKDYTTAYSYFYETFENLSTQDDPSALGALKYMLLCKVMLNLVRLRGMMSVITARRTCSTDSPKTLRRCSPLGSRPNMRSSGMSRVCARSRAHTRSGISPTSRRH